ncbi:cytochrome P450 [Nocardia sp. NBC_01329]|uniref:cytochrome P450 n=1 Tax=Nocardia sp. NBC_01329 TaxID=2903594 RepID=UPI002E165F2D|nr:cytochrome P450 [Nocardia sp. NBC_01329]
MTPSAAPLPPLVSRSRPAVGHLLEFLRSPERLLWRGNREHGLLFRLRVLGEQAVVVLGAEHNRWFFKETDRDLAIDSAYPFFADMFSQDFYYFGGPEEYERQRDIILPKFRGGQLENYVTVMDDETQKWIESLGDSGEFDLTSELGPLVMRIAARSFLGPNFATEVKDFFTDFRLFSGGMGYVPQWIPLPSLIRSRSAGKRLKTSLTAMIHRRRETPLDPPDFLQMLAESQYAEGVPVPDDVLVNLILLLTWAGHETTTGALSWTLADLLGSPTDLARARTEADAAVAAGRLTMASTRGMGFLEDCVYESERMHPVAYIMARRAATDIELDGYRIPEGTYVFTSPWVTHRLADDYPEPDTYRPARYSDPNGKALRQRLIGFGGGIHRCLGVHFAKLEMQIILARMLAAFDLELVNGPPEPVSSGTSTKWPESPCVVRYRVRSSVREELPVI